MCTSHRRVLCCSGSPPAPSTRLCPCRAPALPPQTTGCGRGGLCLRETCELDLGLGRPWETVMPFGDTKGARMCAQPLARWGAAGPDAAQPQTMPPPRPPCGTLGLLHLQSISRPLVCLFSSHFSFWRSFYLLLPRPHLWYFHSPHHTHVFPSLPCGLKGLEFLVDFFPSCISLSEWEA